MVCEQANEHLAALGNGLTHLLDGIVGVRDGLDSGALDEVDRTRDGVRVEFRRLRDEFLGPRSSPDASRSSSRPSRSR